MRVSTKLLTTAAAFMGAVTLASTPAHAVTIFVGPGPTTTPYGNLAVAGGASFDDKFTFTLTAAGNISGSVSSSFNSFKGKTQNIVFTSLKLDGTPFVFTSNGVGVDALGALALGPIGVGNHLLEAIGTNKGNTISSYNGTLNFLPSGGVPEPATWAMMITGFGLLGLASRRRRDLSAATA